jgi:hypothetical protein
MSRSFVQVGLWAVLFVFAAAGTDAAGQDEKKTGTISGVVKSLKEKNKNVEIEVLAPGEEKPRGYFVQYDPKAKAPIESVLKAVRHAKVGDQVIFDWVATNHGPAIIKFEILKKTDEKK